MGGYFAEDVVAISGAGSGIGRALALRFARIGVKGLSLCDRDADALVIVANQCLQAATAAGFESLQVSTHDVDVGDLEQIERWAVEAKAAHKGVISVLINNAGTLSIAPFEVESKSKFDHVMDVNFNAVVHACRVFLPILRKQPRAHVVNVSSMFGYFANNNNASYHASKYAVAGFTYSLYLECKDDIPNVHVHCVHPGFIRTSLIKNGIAITKDAKKEALAAFEMVGQTSPEQCARAILDGVERKTLRIKVGVDAHLLDILVRTFPDLYLSNRFARGALLGIIGAQTVVASKLRDILNVGDVPAMAVSLALEYMLLRSVL